MKQCSKITPEDIELVLWGDLKIMIESSTEENDQGDFLNNQQEWEIVRWRLYEACGVCILELKDGIVIYMLVERRYPLSKELLQRMLDLGLEVEEESTAALQLIERMGTPTQYVYDYWSGWVRLPRCVKTKASLFDGADTESEPFEDPIDTETPESPLTIAPPTSLPESTPPTLVPILCRTARMAVRVPPAMSSGLSDSMAEKRYHGTSELVEDSEEDEDEEIEESLDSDSVSKDAEDEGPAIEDEDPAVGDESLVARDEGPGMDDESHGIDDESRGLDDEGHSIKSDGLGLEEEEEAVPGGQQQAVPVVGTDVSAPLRLGYRALRRRELAFEEDHVYSTFKTSQLVSEPRGSQSRIQGSDSKKRRFKIAATGHGFYSLQQADMIHMIDKNVATTSGSLLISPSPSVVPLPISSPMIPLTVPSLVATPATELSPALFERYDRYIRELFTRSGAVRDEIFSQRYRFRSQTDAQRAALWHAISDMQGENQDLRLQLTEERRSRLELIEVVDSMKRGQEPRGDT
ncbi:hypothetical protein Tco_1447398 [Tanacetum coccineum]